MSNPVVIESRPYVSGTISADMVQNAMTNNVTVKRYPDSHRGLGHVGATVWRKAAQGEMRIESEESRKAREAVASEFSTAMAE